MRARRISWRLQLVLIVMAASGLALGGFIGLLWKNVAKSNYRKFDVEMAALSVKEGQAYLGRIRRVDTPPMPRPQRGPLAFAVYRAESGITERSANWPEELEPGELAPDIITLYRERRIRFAARSLPEQGPPQAPQPPQPPPPPRLERSVYLTAGTPPSEWRILGYSNGQDVFMAARNLSPLREEMADLRRAILLSLPLAIFAIGLAAWLLAGRALAPVRRLTGSAAALEAETLAQQRLQPQGEPPEFERLIGVYNAMLERLEASFNQARRFSADAAHELNTPLTILQGHLDNMLQAAIPGSAEQEQLALVLEETHRLREIIRKLLLLSRADSGRLLSERRPVNVSALIEEVCADARLLAEGLDFREGIDDGLEITGDADLLRQCIFNLLSNAIRYNRPNGSVEVAAARSDPWIRLTVTNTGAAIPDDQKDRIFDRFFRGSTSRGRHEDGRGLGLSLAREFARAHGGTVRLAANHPDAITFQLELPIASRPVAK